MTSAITQNNPNANQSPALGQFREEIASTSESPKNRRKTVIAVPGKYFMTVPP